MRLKSVKLTHFRSYRATTVIPIDEAMTGLLALPEAGESAMSRNLSDHAFKGSRYEQ